MNVPGHAPYKVRKKQPGLKCCPELDHHINWEFTLQCIGEWKCHAKDASSEVETKALTRISLSCATYKWSLWTCGDVVVNETDFQLVFWLGDQRFGGSSLVSACRQETLLYIVSLYPAVWGGPCDGLASHRGDSSNAPTGIMLQKPEFSACTDEPLARSVHWIGNICETYSRKAYLGRKSKSSLSSFMSILTIPHCILWYDTSIIKI